MYESNLPSYWEDVDWYCKSLYCTMYRCTIVVLYRNNVMPLSALQAFGPSVAYRLDKAMCMILRRKQLSLVLLCHFVIKWPPIK